MFVEDWDTQFWTSSLVDYITSFFLRKLLDIERVFVHVNTKDLKFLSSLYNINVAD